MICGFFNNIRLYFCKKLFASLGITFILTRQVIKSKVNVTQRIEISMQGWRYKIPLGMYLMSFLISFYILYLYSFRHDEDYGACWNDYISDSGNSILCHRPQKKKSQCLS